MRESPAKSTKCSRVDRVLEKLRRVPFCAFYVFRITVTKLPGCGSNSRKDKIFTVCGRFVVGSAGQLRTMTAGADRGGRNEGLETVELLQQGFRECFVLDVLVDAPLGVLDVHLLFHITN